MFIADGVNAATVYETNQWHDTLSPWFASTIPISQNIASQYGELQHSKRDSYYNNKIYGTYDKMTGRNELNFKTLPRYTSTTYKFYNA